MSVLFVGGQSLKPLLALNSPKRLWTSKKNKKNPDTLWVPNHAKHLKSRRSEGAGDTLSTVPFGNEDF